MSLVIKVILDYALVELGKFGRRIILKSSSTKIKEIIIEKSRVEVAKKVSEWFKS